MKILISIWLNIALLLVFTTAPTSHAWACGGKSHKKEVKCKSNCKKECCKKSASKHKKDKCHDDCNGNCGCNCTIPVFSFALVEQAHFSLYPRFVDSKEKQAISYKKRFPKSVYLSFSQPPKISASLFDSPSSVMFSF